MANLTEQLKHGAGDALALLAQGWRELRARAGRALTQLPGPALAPPLLRPLVDIYRSARGQHLLGLFPFEVARGRNRDCANPPAKRLPIGIVVAVALFFVSATKKRLDKSHERAIMDSLTRRRRAGHGA